MSLIVGPVVLTSDRMSDCAAVMALRMSDKSEALSTAVTPVMALRRSDIVEAFNPTPVVEVNECKSLRKSDTCE